ncbi:hypothetical protein FZEAL_10798, partial [Fusarium zealandicum]
HIQYHFPKEGDEFPDFVDVSTPVPALAPEERLESQQQVRRHTSTTGIPVRANKAEAGWQSQMSATAMPVSAVWEPESEAQEAVFQPENFMYLGPGTYTDVSPLADEEEEAARRVLAGGIEDRVEKSPGKGVSPLASERTTPSRGQAQTEPVSGESVMVPPTVQEERHDAVSMIDSREIPATPPDPVGIIAEMPTHDTAPANIEMHPAPIEMADNMVLAPIETALPPMAELPERSSPVEKKWEEPQLAPGSLRNYGGQSQPQPRRSTEEATGEFQTYTAVRAPQVPPKSREERQMTLPRRETHMTNTQPVQPHNIRQSHSPSSPLPPRVPPKHPLDQAAAINAGLVDQLQNRPQGNLTHLPSALAPGRNGSRVDSFPIGGPKQASLAPVQADLSHMPSVLKPARGRDPTQAAQFQAFNSGQGHGYVPPAHGQHPPSMTPAPTVQQQRLQQEPRMGIQRVNTVPDSLPSQTSAPM